MCRFLPLNYATVDNCVEDATPVKTSKRLPLLVWSHGLTGAVNVGAR